MKHFAKECDARDFEYEVYFNEDEAAYSLMWLGNNSQFIDTNAEFYNETITALDKCRYDIEDDLEEADLEIDFNYIAPVKLLINYYFMPLRKKADSCYMTVKADFTDEEYKKLYELCFNEKLPEVELVRETRSIIHGISFKSGIINGSCQGDWMEYICPETVPASYIDYVEAVLFATGIEYLVSEEPIESVDDLDYDNGSTYYTCKFYDEDIKKDLAAQIGCEVDELEVYNISSTKTVVEHKYEKV